MKGKIAKYVTVGTNDLQGKKFYDALFEDLGVTSFGPNDRSFFWTIPGDDTNFAVFVPYDGEEATVGNGSMVGITLETTEDVDALYKKLSNLVQRMKASLDKGSYFLWLLCTRSRWE